MTEYSKNQEWLQCELYYVCEYACEVKNHFRAKLQEVLD